MGLIPFPTMRIRDTLRITASVDLFCLSCDWIGPLDVVASMCRYGPNCSVMRAMAGSACPLHGAESIRYRTIGAPSAPYYHLHLGAIGEPACTVVAHCRACHRQRAIDVVELCRRGLAGPDDPLATLADRLRCQGCGQSGWVQIRLGR